MPPSSHRLLRFFSILLFCGAILCCAVPFAWYQQECGSAAYPDVFPDVSPTVQPETTTASMVTNRTTRTYSARKPIEEVERFYIQQMQRFCEPSEITAFQATTDTEHLQPYRQASCWIKGENIPQPTFSAAMKAFDEPESKRIVYTVTKQTTQLFYVELVQRSATETEVKHSEYFTTAC